MMAMKLFKRRGELLFFVYVVFSIFFIFSCSQTHEKAEQMTGIADKDKEYIRIAEIALPGMLCPACASNAQKTFKGMKGVITATVDIRTKKGVVIYDSRIISKKELIENPVIQSYNGKILSDSKISS